MKVILTKEEFDMVRTVKQLGIRCGSTCPFYGKDDCENCPLWQIPDKYNAGDVIDFLIDMGVVEE